MPNRLASSLVAAVLSFAALPLLPTPAAMAQNRLGATDQTRLVNRITQAVTADGPRAALADGVHPRARQAADLGLLPGGTPIESVSVRFSLTQAQDLQLTQLLADQANPASPAYRQWLTPEQYAAQFGLSDGDLARVSAFLQSEGLTVTSVARSHTFLTVSGTAAQIGRAFGTSLHSLSLNGEQHIGNLTAPQVPAALAGVVSAITGLNDFHLKPHVRARQVLQPAYTSSVSGSTFIAPGDLYTIYDINPLLKSSITGAGVTIAVMGQTDIALSSVAAFRTAAGLTANVPTVKLYGTDPGSSSADTEEAYLDVEYSGAVAPSASILYVNSTDVIAGSLSNAIANNLAPIITISYGDCEAGFGSANIATYNQLFRQANAQGQTIVGPSGDSGAADCDYQSITAVAGLAVDFPASSPNVTGVGGTMFNEGAGTYFSTTNNTNGGSALSYIPEAVWNETAAYGTLASSGGGASNYFTKPAFQVGLGVPNDSARDVPDLSLDAAVVHDGYLICIPSFCTNGFRNATGYLQTIGGTSIAAPSLAGIFALLEQKIGARLGNANPVIYGLANSTYSSSVFHDITVGTNAQPCTAGTPNCPNGGTIGYNAGTGYDQTTGWGSVDAYNLVSDWLLVSPTGITSTLGTNASSVTLTGSVSSVVQGTSVTFTAKVASASGASATPTGTVQFLVDNVNTGTAVPLANATASYTLATASLSSGAHVITAAYSGDATYASSKSTITLDVVSASVADFTLTPANGTVTVAAGKIAPGLTFTVTPVNGFTGSVSFTATSLISTLNASYQFSVTPVVITSSTPGTTVLTLSAYAANATSAGPLSRHNLTSAAVSDQPGGWQLAGSGVALAGLLCLFFPGRRRRIGALLIAILSLSTIAMSGCSTSSAGVIPNSNAVPGSYPLTVTATGVNAAGVTISHTSQVTLIVQ